MLHEFVMPDGPYILCVSCDVRLWVNYGKWRQRRLMRQLSVARYTCMQFTNDGHQLLGM